MSQIHVLVSTRVTAEQLERMRNIHPRLVIHGEPGGVAIMQASEVDYKGIDYPEERPDLDVAGMLKKAEVIVATRIPPYLGERAPNLRWIQFTSAGVDHLWKPFLDSGKVTVTSAKGIHAIPLTEFVLSCMLLAAKDWRRLMQQQRDHHWEKFVVQELYGSTVALIGVGEIGGAVARATKQMGMHVIGLRRRPGKEDLSEYFDEVVTFDRMNDALARADYVVASLPLTEKTNWLLDESVFRAMKPSAMFINVGRGKTTDETALARALKEGWIRSAGLDVYEREPLPKESPLWDMPNAFICPHMAPDTAYYMQRLTDVMCDNLLRYAEGRPLRNVVDPVERY